MRVAIVNDMPMAVEVLRRAVSSRPDYKLAWIAWDGEEAVRKCKDDTPDVVLMDLIMPGVNGVEATRRIMLESPCAILVVTATVDGNVSLVFEAMGHGALDAVNTPVFGMDGQVSGAAELLRKIDLIGKLVGRREPSPGGAAVSPLHRSADPAKWPPLIAIGASTGGPAALAEILSRFPADLNAAVVIIQHVDQQFAPDLATWLDGRCPLRVQVAREDDRPAKGVVHLACTNDHLALTPEGVFHYRREPVENFYRPSVDVFFEDVAKCWPTPGVSVLLTGMGRDGSAGLLTLRNKGWRTIAQDERTSVVYGMPKAAAELGAAELVLPLPEIAGAVMKRIGAGNIH